jgi:excisionase family DNA binding protein
MIMAPLGDWLTTQEAADLTGYNVQHVRRLARAGKVITQKWGKDWMIDRKSLLVYIETEGIGPEPKRKKSKI